MASMYLGTVFSIRSSPRGGRGRRARRRGAPGLGSHDNGNRRKPPPPRRIHESIMRRRGRCRVVTSSSFNRSTRLASARIARRVSWASTTSAIRSTPRARRSRSRSSRETGVLIPRSSTRIVPRAAPLVSRALPPARARIRRGGRAAIRAESATPYRGAASLPGGGPGCTKCEPWTTHVRCARQPPGP